MRSNIFSMKALRLALLAMFSTSIIIGVNSCRDEFDEKEALELEHAFLLQLQQQRDDARRQALLDSVQAAQADAQAQRDHELAQQQLAADLQAARDELFMVGGSINYAVNVVDGNSTTFSGNNANDNLRTASEDMSGFSVTVFHQELGTVATAETGPSGIAVFDDLRVGKVTVNVLKPGFTPANFVADITPSSPFERPQITGQGVGNGSVNVGSPTFDPDGYVRSAATVIPVFEVELGNVFDGTQSVPTSELNRYSTITGKLNLETDLTDFDREVAEPGTLISFRIDGDDDEFRKVINRASIAMTNGAGGNTSGQGGTANADDNAEGDGKIIQLSYSDATFTGVSGTDGSYTVIVPAFPTGDGLPMTVEHSSIAADQTLYDVTYTDSNEDVTVDAAGNNAVFGIVTKRTVFTPIVAVNGTAPANPPQTPDGGTIPDFDAVDVSVAHPLANVDGQGAKARVYIDDADGGISRVVMVNGGHNYYAAPWVVFQAGGQGALDGYSRVELQQLFEDPTSAVWDDDVARGTATIENGVVTGVTVTNPGSGYTQETVTVSFIPRGSAPNFKAVFFNGGGCISSGDAITINGGGFTQMPNISISGVTDNPHVSGTVNNGTLAGKYTTTLSGGNVVLTFNEEICGILPGSSITATATTKVTEMIKLRPTIAITGGAIAPVTIAEGEYDDNGVPTTSSDVGTGASTEENVLNGLYTQAPTISISGTGTGASATATLNGAGQVDAVTVVGGTGYDKPNTNISVGSSVMSPVFFEAQFIPSNGQSSIVGNAAARTTSPSSSGAFYTQAEIDAFNANNTSNNLVQLKAWYAFDPDNQTNTMDHPYLASPYTRNPNATESDIDGNNGVWKSLDVQNTANNAIQVKASGTPLNVQYSSQLNSSVTSTSDKFFTTANTDSLDKSIATNVTGVTTPGVNFEDGGQGYSSESGAIYVSVDDADNLNTRLTRARSNANDPRPNDYADTAQFVYELGEGFVTGVTLASSFNGVQAAGNTFDADESPYALVLGNFTAGVNTGTNAVTTTANTVDELVFAAGAGQKLPNTTQRIAVTADAANGVPAVAAADYTVTFGQLRVEDGSGSGTGIKKIVPITPNSNGGRFAFTPELEISGVGSGFEYEVKMAFEHADNLQPTDFLATTQFVIEDVALAVGAAGSPAVPALNPNTLFGGTAPTQVRATFTDIQAGYGTGNAGHPTFPLAAAQTINGRVYPQGFSPASYTIIMDLNTTAANLDAQLDNALDDFGLRIAAAQSFTTLTSGEKYDANSVNTMLLQITGLATVTGTNPVSLTNTTNAAITTGGANIPANSSPVFPILTVNNNVAGTILNVDDQPIDNEYSLDGTNGTAGTTEFLSRIPYNAAGVAIPPIPDAAPAAGKNDVFLEGISSVLLAGRIVSIDAASDETIGSGYALHPTTTYTIRPVENTFAVNVPSSQDLAGRNFTDDKKEGLSLGSNTTSFTATVLSSGDNFPYFEGVPAKEYIRLYKRAGTGVVGDLVPTAEIQSIEVARRIKRIAFKEYVEASSFKTNAGANIDVGVFSSLDENGAGVGTRLTLANLKVGDIGFIPAIGQIATAAIGDFDNASFAGKTVAAIDRDRDGDPDSWALVGNGYSKIGEIKLEINGTRFAGGISDDPAVAEVRSSGLGIGEVTINGNVVTPSLVIRDYISPTSEAAASGVDFATNQRLESRAIEPTFAFEFANPVTPASNLDFGTPRPAGNPYRDLSTDLVTQDTTITGYILYGNEVEYDYRSISPTVDYTLSSVEVSTVGLRSQANPEQMIASLGGAGYTANPFFVVRPNATTVTKGPATGTATAAGGAVTGVTVTTGGSYGTALPDIVINDFLRPLVLKEEGLNNANIVGVGNVSSVIVDKLGKGYETGTTPTFIVVSKGEDHNDINKDGLFQVGEHKEGETMAMVTLRDGADVNALTSADFVITEPGSGYTQDPDLLILTHNGEFLAAPRMSDNPIFFTLTSDTEDDFGVSSGDGAKDASDGDTDSGGDPVYTATGATANIGSTSATDLEDVLRNGTATTNAVRAFTVENSASNFKETDITISTTGIAANAFVPNNAADVDNDAGTGVAAAGGAPNEYIFAAHTNNGGRNSVSNDIDMRDVVARLRRAFFDNDVASARNNQGTITVQFDGSGRGDNLVEGTYPLVIQGGGSNVSTTHVANVVVGTDGHAESITNVTTGEGYDDNAPNPGPDGVLGNADDFTGVKVTMLLGSGASAVAIPDAINVGSVEVTDGGAGYNDEPFSVRIVPAAADRNGTVAQYLADPIGQSNVIEARVSDVTVNATTGAIESITIDPENPGYGYTVSPEVYIENFEAILRREARAAYDAGSFEEQFPTWDFDAFVTAKFALEVDGASGAILSAGLINPGFGYISTPEVRVQGIGSGAVLTAVGPTAETQTGVGDFGSADDEGFNFGYFVGGGAPATINFANHRISSLSVDAGGQGYFGGNFPRTYQAFTTSTGLVNGSKFNVPAAVNVIHDVYYGTGVRNASEVDDNGSNGRKSAADDQ